MLNKDVFKEYGSEQWVIEQNLYFLLQGYWEQLNQKGYIKESQMPINPVGFIKQFMKEETFCDLEYAEKSKLDSAEKSVVFDASFREV